MNRRPGGDRHPGRVAAAIGGASVVLARVVFSIRLGRGGGAGLSGADLEICKGS